MKDPRLRTICLNINGTSYSISFRPALFGRVKDIKIYSGPQGHYLQGLDETVKVEPQNLTAVQALKELCGSVLDDVTKLLRQLIRHRL